MCWRETLWQIRTQRNKSLKKNLWFQNSSRIFFDQCNVLFKRSFENKIKQNRKQRATRLTMLSLRWHLMKLLELYPCKQQLHTMICYTISSSWSHSIRLRSSENKKHKSSCSTIGLIPHTVLGAGNIISRVTERSNKATEIAEWNKPQVCKLEEVMMQGCWSGLLLCLSLTPSKTRTDPVTLIEQ